MQWVVYVLELILFPLGHPFFVLLTSWGFSTGTSIVCGKYSLHVYMEFLKCPNIMISIITALLLKSKSINGWLIFSHSMNKMGFPSSWRFSFTEQKWLRWLNTYYLQIKKA